MDGEKENLVYAGPKDKLEFSNRVFESHPELKIIENAAPEFDPRGGHLPDVVVRGEFNYPQFLLNLGIEGEVTFFVLIKKDGEIKILDLYSFTRTEFIKPARRAIETSKFKPSSFDAMFFLPVRFGLEY